jgi:mannose-6-phosphate isomerase-like protein (cupin superfamily)
MRVYRKTDSPWRCGFWNGSPVEILVSDHFRVIPQSKRYHYHDYHEYYVMLHGRARLLVEGREVPVEANSVLMVQPGERHRVTWVDPDEGARWVVVKERSHPDGKVIVPEPEMDREAP